MATENQRTIRIMLVEDNRDFARLVELFLRKHEPEQFEVVWKENGKDAIVELMNDSSYDVILMDYFLPQQNGLEVTRQLQEKNIRKPVIFLTVNKDFDLAVEVLKYGVEDYLVKDEISTLVLPKTILSVLERQGLVNQLTHLEISEKRLEVIQGVVMRITQEIRSPLDALRRSLDPLVEQHRNDELSSYLKIIKDNLNRLETTIVRMKGLKTDKTVPYIKDIRMIDLSE